MPPAAVSVAAQSMGRRYGNSSKSPPPNVSGHRSAGRWRNPPTAGATTDATPYATAKTEKAAACWVFSVVSPT